MSTEQANVKISDEADVPQVSRPAPWTRNGQPVLCRTARRLQGRQPLLLGEVNERECLLSLHVFTGYFHLFAKLSLPPLHSLCRHF